MKAKATALVDKPLWADVKGLSTLWGKPASEIAEAGLKLAPLIARHGVVNGLGELPAKHDPELLSELRGLHEAWGNAGP